MAKKKHIKTGAGDVIVRKGSLTSQIESEHLAQKRKKPRSMIKKHKSDKNVNEKLAKKILKMASKQREEISDEEKETPTDDK